VENRIRKIIAATRLLVFVPSWLFKRPGHPGQFIAARRSARPAIGSMPPTSPPAGPNQLPVFSLDRGGAGNPTYGA